MKDIVVTLGELVTQTMTRTRGKEAFDDLRQRASSQRASRVYLQMVVDSVVTSSFVDELVQRASELECEGGPEIVFVMPDDEMLDKFQRSVTWRNLSVHYRRLTDQTVSVMWPAKTCEVELSARVGKKPRMQTAG